VPDDRLTQEEKDLRDHLALLPEHTILHLIYQQKSYEGHAKDYEFSRASMQEHWDVGRADMKHSLHALAASGPPRVPGEFRVFDYTAPDKASSR
jgi:hypothetical protein